MTFSSNVSDNWRICRILVKIWLQLKWISCSHSKTISPNNFTFCTKLGGGIFLWSFKLIDTFSKKLFGKKKPTQHKNIDELWKVRVLPSINTHPSLFLPMIVIDRIPVVQDARVHLVCVVWPWPWPRRRDLWMALTHGTLSFTPDL